ncbi:MAG: hypothetical protein IT326_06030 [Anaerolineae bacterium]|nr:hypothetical protein [Anaerolineae bacterium]
MLALPLAQTPDTTQGLLIGYAIIGLIGLLYVASLLWRQHSLRKDIETISVLYEDEDAGQ